MVVKAFNPEKILTDRHICIYVCVYMYVCVYILRYDVRYNTGTVAVQSGTATEVDCSDPDISMLCP